MSQKMQLALALSGLGLFLVEEQRKRRKRIRMKRTKWVKSWISQRQTPFLHPEICPKLEPTQAPDFTNFAKLYPDLFSMLEHLVAPIIRRQNTKYRACISVRERLMVTLHFLATGKSFRTLSLRFRMGVSTIWQFVTETCSAIYQVLKDKYMKCPETVEEWKQVADGFMDRWDFPHCLGALGGMHINFSPPPRYGSTCNPTSVSLVALVDSSYKFLHVNLESGGVSSDDGLLQDPLQSRLSNIPPPAPLPASHQPAPYCVVAGEAFPFEEYILRPYPDSVSSEEQRSFNSRLLWAQRVVDHACSVLTNHFTVLLNTISFHHLAKVENVVLACCALHNLLCSESGDLYVAPGVDQEERHRQVATKKRRQDPGVQKNSQQTDEERAKAEQHREILCRHFTSERKPEYNQGSG